MHSKEKGNIGEAIILSEFTKLGIPVSIPFGDNTRYDLIAEFNGKLNKIQIKYCNDITSTDSIICKCASSTNHTTNKHYTTYENDVDYICAYLNPINKCVIIPIQDIGKQKQINLRLTSPKNNNKDVHYVNEYLFDNFFKTFS